MAGQVSQVGLVGQAGKTSIYPPYQAYPTDQTQGCGLRAGGRDVLDRSRLQVVAVLHAGERHLMADMVLQLRTRRRGDDADVLRRLGDPPGLPAPALRCLGASEVGELV